MVRAWRIPVTPEERLEHLLLCRAVYGHLVDIELQRIKTSRKSLTVLPFNLPILLHQFELYMKWAACHSNVVEMPAVKPQIPVEERGDSA